jgi:hypothetical protein
VSKKARVLNTYQNDEGIMDGFFVFKGIHEFHWRHNIAAKSTEVGVKKLFPLVIILLTDATDGLFLTYAQKL